MTIHLSRDYNTQFTGTGRTYISGYLISLFLRRVLTYSYVGDTNFPINGIGTLLIATGDSTPTLATPTFTTANKAGINNGAGTYHVTIPVAIRTVISADIGRLLVLKSAANPTFNSGIFLITAIDTPNNAYVIDWRSGDSPPAETQAILWYLYAADSATPVDGAPNGGGGYEGNGSSTTPRIILQSPHATAWQVRICIESSSQVSNPSIPWVSIAPGYGGDVHGDFPTFGRHLHGNLWFNQAPTGPLSNLYIGLTAGTGDTQGPGASFTYRHYMVGDDTGQAVGWVAYSSASAVPFNVHFGICDNEPTPLPSDPMLRLFTMGCGYNSGALTGIHFSAGAPDASNSISGGAAFAYGGQIIAATPSAWTFVSNEEGSFQNEGPLNDPTRLQGDSPWSGSTDLLTVEVCAGCIYSWQGTAGSLYLIEPRTMGTIPFFRHGRQNFGNFVTSTDVNKAWLHTLNGVFLLYGGPTVIP